MSETLWTTYSGALIALHQERERIARERSATGADRTVALGQFGDRLSAQREDLTALGLQLRADLTPVDLTPVDLTPVDLTRGDLPAAESTPGGAAARSSWDAGAAELAAAVSSSDHAADEARRLGGRPQLLPAWRSPIARHAVVYAAVVVPNALFTVFLSLSGVTGSQPLLWWFGLIFPVLAAIGGGILVGRLSSPRICSASPDGADAGNGAEHPTPPRRRHRWLAVPFAWASWLVPGYTLDLIAPFLHR
jgi:hypothetical protein